MNGTESGGMIGMLDGKMGRYLTVLALGSALVGCGRGTEHHRTREAPSVKVETVTVDAQRTPDIVDVTGTIRAVKTATVSARVLAVVEKVHVNVGDVVGTGMVLAELDERELRAEYERARLDFERMKVLLEKQAATKAEFDAAQARYRVAETALSHAKIRALFDGLVTRKWCEPGDMAAPGKPLFEMEQPTAFRFEAEVPERHRNVVNVGKAVHVVVDATGEKCVGKVGEVSPVADASSRSFTAKIDLNCRLPVQSGQFGRAELIVGERFGMFVTRGAVHRRGQLTFVYVVEESRARMRLVRTGREYLDLVEIVSGLERGERVVTRSDGYLVDGQRVSL